VTRRDCLRAGLRIGVGLPIGALLAACSLPNRPEGVRTLSGGASAPPGEPPDWSALTQRQPRPAGPPKLGGTPRVVVAYPPETLDPANALTTSAEAVGWPIHERLLTLGPEGEPRPGLAERWEATPDGQIYLFSLRRGVRFHDGTVFDARAAYDNVQRFLGDEAPRRRALLDGPIERARVVDEYQLEVTLTRPYGPFLHQLAQYPASMTSPEARRRWGKGYSQQPCGTGPFRLARWLPDKTVELERWEGHWGAAGGGQARLDGAVFLARAEEPARLELLARGEADVAGGLTAATMPRLEALESAALTSRPSELALGLAINIQQAPFSDPRTRQALNYAVDRAALIREVYGGLAQPLGGPVGPAVAGASLRQLYSFDSERARRLLVDAGHDFSSETVIHASKGRFPRDAELAQAVQRQLWSIGFRARVELLDAAAYANHLTRPPEESVARLTLVGWRPPSGEVREALYPILHSTQWAPRGQNAGFFRQPRLDSLLERATREPSPSERARLLTTAQELVQDEAPWLFLVSPDLLIAHDPSLDDLAIRPSGLATVDEITWKDG
jgi:ABC-type transport system substrate-binding protein